MYFVTITGSPLNGTFDGAYVICPSCNSARIYVNFTRSSLTYRYLFWNQGRWCVGHFITQGWDPKYNLCNMGTNDSSDPTQAGQKWMQGQGAPNSSWQPVPTMNVERMREEREIHFICWTRSGRGEPALPYAKSV